MIFKALIFFFFCLSFAYAEEYQPVPIDGVQMECSSYENPLKWAYCINRVPESTNKDVLYYFHARNGNETWWNDKTYHTGKIYEAWKKLGIDAPTVVTISFGKLWLLTDNPDEPGGGLYNILEEKVLPFIENKVQSLSGKRMLAGISMGGLNSLIVSMKSKGFFKKVASICSPLVAVSPHENIYKVIKYYFDSSTSFKRAIMLWRFSKRFYPSQAVWEKNDPIYLSRSFSPKESPMIYLTCGAKDDWGCKKGSEIFLNNIKKAGGEIQWVPRPGGHCDIDYQSLAQFLD